MTKQLTTIGIWVKADVEPKERDIYFVNQFNNRHGIEDGIYKSTRIFDPVNKWEHHYWDGNEDYEVIEWLQPTEAIVLTKDEWWAVEKIIEYLEKENKKLQSELSKL